MKRKQLVTVVVVLLLFLAVPQEAYARNILRDIGRGIKRGARFVVTLPDKVTRPLGPVLGPIAADLLTQNFLRNPNIGRYFRGARNINRIANNVDEQRRILRQVQADLRNQGQDMTAEADAVRKYKNEIAGQFAGGEMTLDRYQEKVISLDRLAESYDRLSEKFQEAADRMTPERTVKAVGGNVFNRLVREIRDGVKHEVQGELRRYVRPEVISLVTGRGADFNRIIDILVESDIAQDTAGMTDREKADFRKRVRNGVQESLKRNRQGLKRNWREEIRNVIDKVKKDLEKERSKLKDVKSTLVPTAKATQAAKSVPTSAPNQGKCPPGYTYSPRSGIECIQTNCNDIKSGHWDYTGHCVCGSSGSINENPQDPNKECILPHENAACPDCLFACVGLEQSCPKPK